MVTWPCNIAVLHGRPWRVHHSIIMNVTWRRFDQSATRLAVGGTTKAAAPIVIVNACGLSVDVSAKQADVHEITPQSNYIWIRSDGFCYWDPRYELSAAQCSVDVTWFPFDAQICDLIFESWMLATDELNIALAEGVDVLDYYIPSDEWNLMCKCSWPVAQSVNQSISHTAGRVCWRVYATLRCPFVSTSVCPSGPVSVCLSVTSRCSTETAERIELVFGAWASFQPSYTVLKGNSVISKNKGTSLWNFILKFGLRKFRHGISIAETCYQLSSRKVDAQSVINWAVVGQLTR